MLEKIQKTRDYLDYLERHYSNVQKGWSILQEIAKDFQFINKKELFNRIDSEIKKHDLSKLSSFEFVQYRERFFSSNENPTGFDEAWKHHHENNLHHWENWTKEKSKIDQYIGFAQMLCDWMAMSIEFKEPSPRKYYLSKKNEISIPDWAEKILLAICDRIEKEDALKQ